jgi:hypothetical protein
MRNWIMITMMKVRNRAIPEQSQALTDELGQEL